MERFSEKTYEKTCCFIIYFQRPVHIVHVDEVLRSGYFFQKFDGPLNLMSIFFTFHRFCEKVYEKTYQFYSLFSNVLLLLCTFTKFSNLKHFFFFSNGDCSKMLTIYFSFPQLSATFAIKLKKRPTIFYTYLKLWL